MILGPILPELTESLIGCDDGRRLAVLAPGMTSRAALTATMTLSRLAFGLPEPSVETFFCGRDSGRS